MGGRDAAARTIKELGGGSKYALGGNPLMHHLAATGASAPLQLLLDVSGGDGVDARNEAGCTALTVAVLHGVSPCATHRALPTPCHTQCTTRTAHPRSVHCRPCAPRAP